MVARRKTTDARSSAETDLDVAFAGWDPYIVAITGGDSGHLEAVPQEQSRSSAPESRELRLMAWLRKHGEPR